MTGFSTVWLDLREPADHAARDAALLAAAADHGRASNSPLVVDLGCGTGSTMRAFGSRLGAELRWRLVDLDADLLAEAKRRTGADTLVADLSGDIAPTIAGARLVTASALFDLVSEAWLDRLAAAALAEGAAVYAVLSYDGTTTWGAPHPLDATILDAFNADMRRDKGFGPALGPLAASAAPAAFDRAGFRVATAASPWHLGPGDASLTAALAEGIAAAVAPVVAGAADWLAHRRATTAAGATVGHTDLLAVPA